MVKPRDTMSFGYVAGLGLPTITRRKGARCYRIHRAADAPLWFGPDPAVPVSGRFNAPGREYGICYFGMSLDVTFAETLLRNPGHRLMAHADLAARSVSIGHLTRPIRLAQLHGSGLRRLRLTAEIVHGPHPACRSLALALWLHREEVDGIAYRSRFDNDELCIALFDRAADAVAIEDTAGLLVDARALGRIIDKYDVGLDP